jgi:hypothetical protein
MKSPADHARSTAFGLKIDLFNNAMEGAESGSD